MHMLLVNAYAAHPLVTTVWIYTGQLAGCIHTCELGPRLRCMQLKLPDTIKDGQENTCSHR